MLAGGHSFYSGAGGASGAAPTSVHVTAVPDMNSIRVAWGESVGATAYEVRCAVSGMGGESVMRSSVPRGVTSLTIPELSPDIEYIVSVTPTSSVARGNMTVRRVRTPRSPLMAAIDVCGGALPEDSEMHYPMTVDHEMYGNMVGGQVAIDGEEYEFISFECGSIIDCSFATLELVGCKGDWCLHNCGDLLRTTLHVQVRKDGIPVTAWMDANHIHVPYTDDIASAGYRCLRIRGSDVYRRAITFGSSLLSGDVVARVGITRDNRRICGIVVADS